MINILKKIEKKFRGIGRRIGLMDDFNWSVYNQDEYSKQVCDLEKEYTFVMPDGKYSVVNGRIILDSNILPLNENHRALYEAILALKPDSILEVGCGCGDHLANIKKILPAVKLNGLDLLEKQLEFLQMRHPELKNQANLFIQDITSSVLRNIKTDLVYTQAVLMHIQRRNSYLRALKNVFSFARKSVVLMENWTRHNFFEDIMRISEKQDFPWQNIYFYINDTGRQISLILSAFPLTKFNQLKDNRELLKYSKLI